MTIDLTMEQVCEIRIGLIRSCVDYEKIARLAAERGDHRAEEIYLGYVREAEEILSILDEKKKDPAAAEATSGV